jgi:hypothetical protein
MISYSHQRYGYLTKVLTQLKGLLGSGWWEKKGGTCIYYKWSTNPMDYIFR